MTDSRSWCARQKDHDDEVNENRLHLDLLALYSQIPDKDVHLMAERYREMFYYHAHVALRYIFQKLKDKTAILNDMEGFCDVALQVFSHRFQQGDEEIVEFIKG